MKFFLALLVALFFSAVMAEVDETAVVELSTDNFDVRNNQNDPFV